MPSATRGTTLITDIRHGTVLINEVRRGANLVWTRSVKRDDFNRANSATVGSNWTSLGPSSDYLLGIENKTARVKIPDGLFGGVFALRGSNMRWNVSVATGDNGYIECRPATRGDGFSLTSLSGFSSTLYGRANNTGSTLTNGIGIHMQAGTCGIASMSGGSYHVQEDGGNFQPGDRLRLTYVGDIHTLFRNGAEVAQWEDTGHIVARNSSNRSMVLGATGGKDALGPRRFSPALDYVLMA